MQAKVSEGVNFASNLEAKVDSACQVSPGCLENVQMIVSPALVGI